MHNFGIFELLFYLLAIQLIVEGSLMDKEESTGVMIACTSLIIIFPLFNYSTFLHTRKIRAKKDPEKFINLVVTWLMACYVPMAIVL